MKKAFTLSELLLALGIVAVISSLMITTVIPKGDEKKYSSLAHKAYLTLEEAYDVQIMNDAGQDARDYGAGSLLYHMITGTPSALPYYANEGKYKVQLPNGMILYNTSGTTKGEGFIYVDLDGIEGKTKTTLSNAKNLTGLCTGKNKRADVLRFIIENSDISPDYNCGFAKEYLEYDDSLE